MFSVRSLMDPAYATKTVKGNVFSFQMSLQKQPTAMNWADPYRPNDTVPPHIKEAVIKSLNSNAAHYCYPTGDIELCAEIAKRVHRLSGVAVDPAKNIIVTNGSDTAFAYVMRPFLVPGEYNEVLVPAPPYVLNFETPPLLGGKTVVVPTREEDGFDLDMTVFEKRVSAKTKIVILTNPNNPTGQVYKKETLQNLADFCIKHNLLCVVDQCFEDSVFDGNEHTNFMALPGMFERTISISSFSKGMALCGFRVAYVVVPEDVGDVLRATAVSGIGATNTMAQAGVLAVLRQPDFIEDLRQEWMARARILDEILETIPHISYVKPRAGFFFWINTSYYGTDEEVTDYLVQAANVLVSPGRRYASDQHIRLIYGAL